jgi:hypothetical protein
VKVRYVANSKAKSESEGVMQTIKLQDVWSTGTTRKWDEEVPALEIGLEETQDDSVEVQDSGPFDEAWWDEFDDKLADHLEDLGIEE